MEDHKEEIKNYIKENLKIEWQWNNFEWYICLILDGEVISKIPFEARQIMKLLENYITLPFDMDNECIDLCNLLNTLPGVTTF